MIADCLCRLMVTNRCSICAVAIIRIRQMLRGKGTPLEINLRIDSGSRLPSSIQMIEMDTPQITPHRIEFLENPSGDFLSLQIRWYIDASNPNDPTMVTKDNINEENRKLANSSTLNHRLNNMGRTAVAKTPAAWPAVKICTGLSLIRIKSCSPCPDWR